MWEMKPGNLDNRLADTSVKSVVILTCSIHLTACLCVPVILMCMRHPYVLCHLTMGNYFKSGLHVYRIKICIACMYFTYEWL